MKRFIYFLAAILSPLFVVAYDFEYQGIYYNINAKERTATVTAGPNSGSPYEGHITIPPKALYNGQELPVTKIGNSAFQFEKRLREITIPSSVTEIEDWAFASCTALQHIEIPNSVKTIKPHVFHDCTHLTTVKLPDDLKIIPANAFTGCIRLNSIELPKHAITIGGYAFSHCKALTSIRIPDEVQNIYQFAFEDCDNLNLVEIGSSLKLLDKFVFTRCPALTRLVICNGKNPITIDADFMDDFGYSLREVYIGRNVIYYGNSPFVKSYNVEVFSLGPDVTNAKNLSGLTKNQDLRIIYSWNPVPPAISDFSDKQYVNTTLIVPKGCLSAYKANPVWGHFWKIEEYNENQAQANSRTQFKPKPNIIPNGKYYIYPYISRDFRMDNGGLHNEGGWNAHLYERLDILNQQWVVENTAEGIILRTAEDNELVLDNSNNLAQNQNNIGIWHFNGCPAQIWYPEKVGGNTYVLRNSLDPNFCIDLPRGALYSTNNIQLWEYLGGDNQKWVFEPVPETSFRTVTEPVNNGIYLIGSQKDPNYVISSYVDDLLGKTHISLWEKNSTNNIKWDVENKEDGIILRVHDNPDLVLDINPKNNGRRGGVMLNNYNGNKSQIWIPKQTDDSGYVLINASLLNDRNLREYYYLSVSNQITLYNKDEIQVELGFKDYNFKWVFEPVQ